MAAYDLAVRNGTVLVGGELVAVDVLIRGESVAALSARGSGETQTMTAIEEIDAAGLLVLPGGVDTHTHTRDPGYTQKEDFLTASHAAAAGGITTIIDMPNVEPPTDTVETFLQKRARADQLSIVDWGHWVAGTRPAEIPRLAEAGATGFKIFQVSGAYPHDPRLAINDESSLMASFRAIAATGLPCLVHPFNQSLFEHLSEEAFAAGKPPDGRTFSEVYANEAIWHTAVNTLINLQRLTGVRLHLLHTHSAGSLALIRRAKAEGAAVTAEIDPKYYHLTLEDLDRMGPRVVPAGFVTEDSGRMEEIRRSLRDGTIDNIGADHAPHLLEEIEVANTDAWSSHLGNPQLEWLYSLILTDVDRGELPLAQACRLLSENPARLVGAWPRKGNLLPGADADMALVDPAREWSVTDEGAHTKCGWSPWAGRTLKGRVVMTLLRGSVIAREGEVVAEPGFGRYVPGEPQ